jgi:opacity protein-like surface antigen
MSIKKHKLIPSVTVVLFLAAIASVAFAQVAPSAREGGYPLRVGVGFSSYYTELWPNTRQTGLTLWADWTFRHMPRILHGLGVEAEGRDLGWGQPNGSGWSLGTLGGGPIYSYRKSQFIQPYVKGLVNYGAQWDIALSKYSNSYGSDKWMTYAVGGGLDLRIRRGLMVRGDYEYQYWKTNWFNTTDYLNPQGFTLSVAYDLGAQHTVIR